MRWLPIAVFLVACGGPAAQSAEPAAPDGRPRLDGVAVLDVPIDEASADAREVWQTSERLLEDRGPQPPADLGIEDYMGWMRAIWAPWLEGRVAIMRDLRARFAALADVGPPERVFSSVVAGYLYEDLARLIEGLPVPVEVQGDREMSAAFASQLRAQAAPAWARAREAWSHCIDWAPDAQGELAGWGDACTLRLAALPDIEPPASAAAPIAWPEECTTTLEGARPDAIADGPTGRRPIALLFEDRGPLTEDERDRVADAVFRRLRRTHRALRLLPLAEVRRARAAATGTAAGGAACVRRRSLVSLLRARHPDLVPGVIAAECVVIDGERACYLDVSLGRQADGSPLSLGTRLEAVSFAVADWLEAVEGLTEATPAYADVFGASGLGRVGGAVQIRDVSAYGEWGESDARAQLRPAEQALSACAATGASPSSDLRVVLDVAPDGAVTDISIGRRASVRARRDCVNAVFEDLQLSAGTGERRLTFSLAFYPESPVALPYRALERALHPTALRVGDALGDRFLRDSVARCHAETPGARQSVASYRATITVGPDGSPRAVDVTGLTVVDGVTDAVRDCVRGALEGARFACPPDGQPATVEATLCVGGR